MTKHLCCQVSKECWHNTTPERIQEIVDAMKAHDKEQEAQWARDNNIEPFDMNEWYRRIGK